jgi:hypothetical protein
MRTLPVHLDRLAAALKAKGVTLKRNSLLEVAASAFGYHSQNQLTAASRDGDLDPSPARAIGVVSVGGRRMALLEDGDGRAFGMEARTISDDPKAASFVVSPYGGLVDLRLTGALPDLDGKDGGLHFASITHEYGSNLYCDTTEEGLRRQIADWCREYWDQEGVDGSYEGLSDEEVCDAYFEHSEDDGVTYFDGDVKIPASGSVVSRSTPFVPEDFDMRTPYIVARTTGDMDEPVLYWSNDDGWVDAQTATVFREPPLTWPTAGIDAGSLFVVPLPATERAATKDRPYLNRNGKGLDIVFLTNRECDVQGPADRAAEAAPWIEADEIEVGLGPIRTAEIGYAALVDGQVYLAPTIKAFHFDADEPIRAMRENSDELREYAAAIEPAIRTVGGMVMLEEDTEAVMLTILVPLHEARRAADLDSWKDALEDLITPGGSGPRIMARFRPQTSVGESCYDADPLGDDRIDVTYELKLMGAEAVQTMEDSDDEAEALKDAVRAPEWVREWYGPFGVAVRDAAAEHYGFDPDDVR